MRVGPPAVILSGSRELGRSAVSRSGCARKELLPWLFVSERHVTGVHWHAGPLGHRAGRPSNRRMPPQRLRPPIRGVLVPEPACSSCSDDTETSTSCAWWSGPGRVARMWRCTPLCRVSPRGVQGAGHRLPHVNRIQQALGPHRLDAARAYTDTVARAASRDLGADAYTIGDNIAQPRYPAIWPDIACKRSGPPEPASRTLICPQDDGPLWALGQVTPDMHGMFGRDAQTWAGQRSPRTVVAGTRRSGSPGPDS